MSCGLERDVETIRTELPRDRVGDDFTRGVDRETPVGNPGRFFKCVNAQAFDGTSATAYSSIAARTGERDELLLEIRV